jgi:hypothetical protein
MQKTRESLRSYISRWLSLRNTSENISSERAIDAFRDGLIRRDFREELGRCKPKTIDHLMSLANEWADGEDSVAVPRSRRRSADRDVDPKDQFYSSSRKKGRRNRYEDADTADMVAAGYVNNDRDDNHDGPRQGNNYYGSSSRSVGRDSRPRTEWRRRRDAPPLLAEEMLNGGCTRHTYIDKDGRQKPAHLLIECREFLRLSQALQDKMRTEQPVAGSVAYNAPPLPPNPPANVVQQGHQAAMIQHVEPRQPTTKEEAFPLPRGFVPMIQRGRPTNQVQRKHGREVFHTEHGATNGAQIFELVRAPIGFDRSDHPPKIPRPGHHALVLEAQIGGFTSKKVFMDGGSSLNLIYADMLRKIKIPMDKLLPTETSFHGIVPGKPTYPLGAIHLDVIFGTPANFRKEKIEFEVVDWPLQYHAILGRPTFARFMAVPHYAYLKLRMPAKRGPLMISESFTRSENCDKDFNSMSQTFGVHEELNHITESTNMDVDPPAQQNAPELSFNASKDTREHQIHPTDPTKTARVSNSLSPT